MPKKTKQKEPKIGVIICALNEEETIEEIVKKSKKYCNEVCVVDGHSNDKTVEVASGAGAEIIYDNKKGKGDAIRTAACEKDYDIFVFMDADGSHKPEEIPHLLSPIIQKDIDHVGGSRLLGGSDELHGTFDEFLRLSGSAFITWCINARFNVRISDSQNGFRALKGSVIKSLDLKENKTTIEQEMIIKTFKNGYLYEEVPTHELKRKHGKSKINVLKIAHLYVFSLLKYLFL